jgi:type IV pilus assembly protein PilY1
MSARKRNLRPWLLGLAVVSALGARAGATEIATVPLVTSAPSTVLPNLMFVLDDSGSMAWDYMPDWVNDGVCRSAGATSTSSGTFSLVCDNGTSTSPQPPFRSSSFNGIYYNPAIRYLPPVNSSGVSYPSQTSANTAAWTSVKTDGYNIQSTQSINLLTNFADVEWCTDGSYTDCLRNGNYVLPGTVNSKN